jgi:hypothetical protein
MDGPVLASFHRQWPLLNLLVAYFRQARHLFAIGVKRRRQAKHIYYSLSDTHILQLVESAMEHAAERQ